MPSPRTHAPHQPKRRAPAPWTARGLTPPCWAPEHAQPSERPHAAGQPPGLRPPQFQRASPCPRKAASSRRTPRRFARRNRFNSRLSPDSPHAHAIPTHPRSPPTKTPLMANLQAKVLSISELSTSPAPNVGDQDSLAARATSPPGGARKLFRYCGDVSKTTSLPKQETPFRVAPRFTENSLGIPLAT